MREFAECADARVTVELLNCAKGIPLANMVFPEEA